MTNELQNIPALWTALSHWLACMLYAWLLPGEEKRKPVIIAQALAFLAILSAAMYFIVRFDGTIFNILYVFFALLCMLPGLFYNKLGIVNAAYYCARGFILGGFTASLAWQLYIFFEQRYSVFSYTAVRYAHMIAVYAVVYAVMLIIEKRQRRELTDMPISALSCGSTVFIAFLIYILSSLSFVTTDTPFSGSTYAEAFNVRTLVYFGGVAILFAHHLQLYEAFISSEVTTLHNMLDMQYANYRVSEESIEMVNRKYHDLKHQIAVFRGESGDSVKSEALDKLERDIALYETQNRTGNRVLDTILTSKSIHCQKLGIQMTGVVDGSAMDFMDVMDLSSLFGNALDNAIESASKLPEPEQRLVHLSVSRTKGFIRIQLENRCAEMPKLRGGLPITTKADKRFHGFGVKSIRATAEKYGGSVTMSVNDGWFELRILFPLPVKSANPAQ